MLLITYFIKLQICARCVHLEPQLLILQFRPQISKFLSRKGLMHRRFKNQVLIVPTHSIFCLCITQRHLIWLECLLCLSCEKFESYRGHCKLWQNIDFIVMIVLQIWPIIPQDVNNDFFCLKKQQQKVLATKNKLDIKNKIACLVKKKDLKIPLYIGPMGVYVQTM